MSNPQPTRTQAQPTTTPFKFNPFLPEFHADPYPIYARLRREDPIYQTQSFQGKEWLLTRYADVKAVLNDPRFSADDLPRRLTQKSRYLNQPQAFETLTQTIGHWLFFLDPPDHGRLRSLMSKAFSTGEVEQLRPHIQNCVTQLLDRVANQQSMDVMADLACPLPAMVSAHLLGVTTTDRAQLTQWAKELFRVFDQPLSLEDYHHLNQVARDFKTFFEQLIAARAQDPGPDLLSRLIMARDQGDRLNQTELLAVCAMIFSVGQETTENFIGNSVLALLRHPDQLHYLRQHPESLPQALEELLRYDSPVQIIARVAQADIELDGKTLQPGGRVHLCLGAANRDPDQFPQPDQLDLTRQGTTPMPFGAGIHYCLGAALARLEGQIALATLLQRFPDLQLTPEPLVWRQNLVLRGLRSLPIRWMPS